MRSCPRCKGTIFWVLSTGQKRCKTCGLTRKTIKKTWWNTTRISSYWKGKLVEYFALGLPVYRIRFRCPYHRSTVERWFRILRTVIYRKVMKDSASKLSGKIELDETMFGGRRKGKRGWGAKAKHMVFGIYKRNGHVTTHIIGSRDGSTLIPLIGQATKSGSLYYTDDWYAYAFLPIRGEHVVVKKQKGVPQGRDHLNGIEGFWSYAKTWLYQYRGVPKQYFHLYLKEVEWRFNNRDYDLLPLLRKLLNQRIVKEQI